MKNAVITAKLPSGKWESIYISENITEAKKEFSRINSAEYTEDSKGYLQFNLFYQPQRRKVSKSGRISEHELKEAAKAKRAKEKAYEKQREEEEKLIKDKQAKEKAAQVKEKIASGKLPKPAKKKEDK